MVRLFSVVLLSASLLSNVASAIAKYDEGRLEIGGIQLFQDSENANAYYYLPPQPRVSVRDTGEFEFLCTKYVGLEGKRSSGGLFHVLAQFSLTALELRDLENRLREIFPKARIVGGCSNDGG
jgi:hypothetical protein